MWFRASVSALMLFVGRQEGHPAFKSSATTVQQKSFYKHERIR